MGYFFPRIFNVFPFGTCLFFKYIFGFRSDFFSTFIVLRIYVRIYVRMFIVYHFIGVAGKCVNLFCDVFFNRTVPLKSVTGTTILLQYLYCTLYRYLQMFAYNIFSNVICSTYFSRMYSVCTTLIDSVKKRVFF